MRRPPNSRSWYARGSRVTGSVGRPAWPPGLAKTRKVIELAKLGDTVALRLCLDRIVAPRRDMQVDFVLPPLNSASDASRAMAAITAAVACGELTPTDAAEMSGVIVAFVKALEASEIEPRERVLEEGLTQNAK